MLCCAAYSTALLRAVPGPPIILFIWLVFLLQACQAMSLQATTAWWLSAVTGAPLLACMYLRVNAAGV